MTRRLTPLLLAALALALAGCSGSDEPDVAQRIERLETEQRVLRERVDRLLSELEPTARRVQEIDKDNRRLDKALAQVEEDLRSRLHEMVQDVSNGGWRNRTPRVERPAEVALPPAPPRPYLGFDAQTISAEIATQLKLVAKAGVLVTAVREGAPAAAGGIQKDDIVIQADGADVTTKSALAAVIARKKPGDGVLLALLREGKKIELTVTLGRQ